MFRGLFIRIFFLVILLMATLFLGGCRGNLGVGLSVGIPVGDHGYVSVGSGRWL